MGDPALVAAEAAGGAFLAGLVAALTGLGGGVIMVPVFTLLVGLPLNAAATLSLVSIVANATVSSSRYAARGLVDSGRAPYLALGAIAGGPLGSWLAFRVDERYLYLVFAVVLLYTSMRLVASRGAVGGPGGEAKPSPLRSSGLGLAAGVTAGLLGVGGGVVMVPILVNVERMPTKRAVATSSLITSISASSALAKRLGFLVDAGLWYAPAVAIAASLGSYVGSVLMVRLRGRVLALILAAVLALAAVRMILRVAW